MIILAIETSCDDTCASVLRVPEDKKLPVRILSNVISSQIQIHRKWGGVFPSMAKREHQKNLPVVIQKAVREAGSPRVDAIAITHGPGLEPCLWTGIQYAKDMAHEWNVPIIPVNHIEAHIYSNWASPIVRKKEREGALFPALCLVVSGGHTELLLMKKHLTYTLLGETKDDAAGECFDKTARILGLPYPGGPEIEKRANTYDPDTSRYRVALPRPLLHEKSFDFSFSGLKTAVLYHTQKQSKKTLASKAYIRAMCHEIQEAAFEVLVKKTLHAAHTHQAKSILVAGGVSANEALKKMLRDECKKESLFFSAPPYELATDNAAMIGIQAGYQIRYGKHPYARAALQAKGNLRI